jgi:hypothetical protein
MARGKKKGQHGGYRQPAKPAPVSAPGSGTRTDGGPGNERQPLRVPTGQSYGERQASLAQQRAAPLDPGSSVGGGGTVSSQAGAIPPIPPEGAFAPPATTTGAIAGRDGSMDYGILDPEAVLRIMYDKYPSPWIARLLDAQSR